MSNDKSLRPHTQVLTRGFDPSLSVGSARPAVFRSSTYVFSSPEAAERAFDLMAGRGKATEGEQVVAGLMDHQVQVARHPVPLPGSRVSSR